MKYLYNRKGSQRGEGDRTQHAFFVVGAIVVMVAMFLIGLQVGRVIERGGRTAEAKSEPAAAKAGAAASDIKKDLGAFSRDAVSVPIVPPPDAKEATNDVEKSLTFRDTLSKKEDVPVPLERAAPKDNASVPKVAGGGTPAGGRGFLVQIGAFRDKGIAESYRRKMEKAGFPVKTVKGTGKTGETLYRVFVGPYAEKDAARRARKRIKSEMKIDAFLLRG